MRVSVIIPVYNALALAKACVDSIFATGSDLPFEVIVVDNGSAPEVEEWLLRSERTHAGLRHLRYSEPLGFARAVNAGASAATGETLIVLNSDTIVSTGWMDALREAVLADPELGAVTPVTNLAGEPAQVDHRTIGLSAAKALALTAAQPSPSRVLHVSQRLVFFCVALRREVWLELGGLSEAYRVGNFEDDDMCLRLRVAGYRLGVAQHVFVYHHMSATFRANRIDLRASMSQNAVVFANRARELAEAPGCSTPHWPKRSAQNVSVVIEPRPEASLDITLRSLQNQTVCGFEIILPDHPAAPTRSWVAHITQGDIFYPIYLETLLEVLDRTSADAIFSDGWIADTNEILRHPDAGRLRAESPSFVAGPAPIMRAGWMHHSSLDPDALWENTVPMHWELLTWERTGPVPRHHAQESAGRNRRFSVGSMIGTARQIYRFTVPLRTRLAIDARIRKVLHLPPGSEPADHVNIERRLSQLGQLAAQLETLAANQTDAGKFQADTSLPAVVFLNTVPWNSVVQRPHHFARGLAARGHEVFWVETDLHAGRNWWTGRPLRQPAPGLHLLRLPGPTHDIYRMPWHPPVLDAMCAALTQVKSAYGIRDAVSLVNFPRWQPLATSLRERCGWKIIYDCLDDQRAFADLYGLAPGRHEDHLIDTADLLIASGAVLEQRLRSRRAPVLLHNAADYEVFSSGSPGGPLERLPRPVAGFFGAVTAWLDMDLIRAAAIRFPDWSFVFIGPQSFPDPATETRWRRSTNLSNITVLSQMDHPTLVAHLADFDVCIMPFLDVPVTRTMNPVKIYEYLAAGKPVVSRDLPEMRHLAEQPGASELIALYSTPEQFFERLREAAATDTPDLAARRQRFAQQNDWSRRVDVLSREIVELVYDTSSISASSRASNTRSQE